MLKHFLPDQHVKSIFEITPHSLQEKGVKGIITDLDNTLVEWDRPNATPKLISWFEEMKQSNIKVTIVSNNNENRVKAFSHPLDIPFIYQARKPMGRAFRRALSEMGLRKEETVVIGDQLLTDVLGETEAASILFWSCLSLRLTDFLQNLTGLWKDEY